MSEPSTTSGPRNATTPDITADDVVDHSIGWESWLGERLGIKFDAVTDEGERTYHLYDRGTDEKTLQYCWSFGAHAENEQFCQDHDSIPEDVAELVVARVGMMGFDIDVRPPTEVFDDDA